jgi:formylglycine-generating enzyme required for sulfatase activity
MVSITGATGAVYAIECASALWQSNSWVTLTNLAVPSSPFLFQDTTAPSVGNRFYRLQAQGAGDANPTNPNPAVFAWVGPGTFIMGSPPDEAERWAGYETQHRVTLTRGFFMAKYLVTQQDYLAVTQNNPSFFNGDLTLPVETVSWEDATNYCLLRTRQEQAAGLIPTNYVYRLPTEAEWEYACRAGTTTAFYLGSDLASGQANFDGAYGYDGALGDIEDPAGIWPQTTTPVGSYAPNQWGLYDMIGNVYEWCQDVLAPYPGGNATDPQGPSPELFSGPRVERGGSWGDYASCCRSAYRFGNPHPYGPSALIGFRVVVIPLRP